MVSASSEPSSSNLLYSSEMKEISFQRIEGHAVQLDQHLGIALGRVDAFEPQERSGSACVKMPISGGHAVRRKP